MTIKSMSHARGMAMYATIMGYPECCIAEFITTFDDVTEHRKLMGTGYIPCAKCNARHTEQKLKETIEINRLYPLSFHVCTTGYHIKISDTVVDSLVNNEVENKIKRIIRKVKFVA